MPDYRPVEYPVRLSTAELFFFLSFLYHHDRIPGAHNATLFPADDAAREALAAQGAQEAEANGWFDPNVDGNGNAWLDERILLLVACLVDPIVAIESTVDTQQAPPAQINHFIAVEMIVEMTLEPGDIYALSELESLETMTGRLANVYGMAANDERAAALTLTTQQVREARQQPSAAQFQQGGADPNAAAWLADTFAHPARAGVVTLYQVVAGEPTEVRQIGVMVGADGTGWIGQPVTESELAYTLVDKPRFEATIAETVAELAQNTTPASG